MRCECLLESLEEQYIDEAKAAGVDLTSSFEGREGTSVDAFHFRHLQSAVKARTPGQDQEQNTLFQEPYAPHNPLKGRRQKTLLYPYGSGEAWR